MATRLYLVRHGATQLTAENRFAGSVGVELSDEGRSQVRTRQGPRMMAILRNLAIAILRLLGFESVPRGLRHFAQRPRLALTALGL